MFAARSRIVLVVVLAARLFAARPRGVLVVVVAARGGRGCRRFLAGDAGLSFCRLACLAFERAGAGGLLAQIGDKSLGHVLAARRLALDRHVTSKCALCRAQAAIYLAREAAEASELGLGGADQLGRIRESSRPLRRFGGEFVEGGDNLRSQSIAGDGPGKRLQVVNARTFAALRDQLLEFALFLPAGGFLRRSQLGFLTLCLGLSCLLFAGRTERGSFRGRLVSRRLVGFLSRFRGLAFGFRGFGLLLGLRGPGTAFIFFALLCRGEVGRGSPGLLLGFGLPGAALIFLALFCSRQFGFPLLGLLGCLFGGFPRCLALGASLVLALLGSFLQDIDALLGAN